MLWAPALGLAACYASHRTEPPRVRPAAMLGTSTPRVWPVVPPPGRSTVLLARHATVARPSRVMAPPRRVRLEQGMIVVVIATELSRGGRREVGSRSIEREGGSQILDEGGWRDKRVREGRDKWGRREHVDRWCGPHQNFFRINWKNICRGMWGPHQPLKMDL